ncbi:MAG: aldolase [Candidatus Hydrogenedentota bacterium]|nr:MAG: aldolase [Candidatus Hydrogenedentota bacterium]
MSDLRKKLQALKDNSYVAGLKTGTEIEDMGEAEIAFLREVSNRLLPLTVKIGGAEARQDMRICLRQQVDIILAPMIETVYALQNFVTTAMEIMEEENQHADLAINLESYTACNHLNEMIASRYFDALSRVTIGRGDLSGSMHLSPDDALVLEMAAQAVRKIKNAGKKTSVGGSLKPASIKKVLDVVKSDYVNTRHLLFQVNPLFIKKAPVYVQKGLEFEWELYEYLENQFSERKTFYTKRKKAIEKRFLQISLNKNQMGKN